MRITNNDLETLANRINELTNSPKIYSDKGTIQIGHYYIDGAYGGVQLVRITNDGGAIRTVSQNGYSTKKELYNFMIGFINGLELNK